MKKLILITGDLAAGKSTLAKKLATETNSFFLTKDTLKEILSDTIGFSNRQENKKLSIASVQIMYYIFDQYAMLNKQIILEANFHTAEIEHFITMAKQKGYQVILLYLQGDIDELYQRFTYRIKEQNRHPTHCTEDILSKENFEKYIKHNRQELESFEKHLILVSGTSSKDANYEQVFEQALKIIKN